MSRDPRTFFGFVMKRHLSSVGLFPFHNYGYRGFKEDESLTVTGRRPVRVSVSRSCFLSTSK